VGKNERIKKNANNKRIRKNAKETIPHAEIKSN